MLSHPGDRPYQAACIEKLRESAKQGHRSILVVSPTASGKTWLASRLMDNATRLGKRSAFFADQIELVDQASRTLDTLGVPHNTVKVANNRRFDHDTLATVISKDTLWARSFRGSHDRPKLDMLIFDEAHKSLAKTWQAIQESYPQARVIGLTATPVRTDGRGLGEIYDDLVVMATYSELIRDKRIVPVKIWAPHRPDLKGVKTSQGDYAKAQLEERMRRDVLIGDIIEDWKKRAERRKTVVFASSLQHSIEIAESFNRMGIEAKHIDGSMTSGSQEREDIIGSLRDGSLEVICNYGVLTTGVDVPALKYMVNARPTKSWLLWRQMAGRIMRACPGHDECVIQDHSDCSERFGFPDEDVEWELGEKRKIQDVIEQTRQGAPETATRQCGACEEMFKGAACPECGWRAPRYVSEQQRRFEAGELVELDRAKARKQATIDDKNKFWRECLGRAMGLHRDVQFASILFMKKFGVWPNRVKGLSYAANASVAKMPAREFYNKYIAIHKVAETEGEAW